MEHVISKLLSDFENGRMNRRQLIQSLALAATAASAASGYAAPAPGFKTMSVDHISYQVNDYKRARDFYSSLMGMTVAGDNGTQCELHFGESMIIARNRKQPNPKATGFVDHIAFRIADLQGRGLKPRLDTGGGEGYASFHVTDPDGFDLQISGDPKPGDPLYKKK
jgi:catechol 2,3-dioxygenase-like lactoylglutathione lyase family enzyme